MKRHITLILSCAAFAFLIRPEAASGQLSAGGVPPSVRYNLAEDPYYLTRFDPPDLDRIRSEDEAEQGLYRFGVILPADIGIGQNGYWTDLPDGAKIWRYSLHFPGAMALTLYFDRFRLPAGGRLFIYDREKRYVLGAFTSANNALSGRFATSLVPGDRVTMEYRQPSGSQELPDLHIDGVTYAYRGAGIADDRGTAGPCEVNVNCPEGNQWQKQKRGVVRIQVRKSGGNFWCTGSLVNNTRWDHTPYILTADHCGAMADSADLEQWIFYFNFERSSCDNQGTIPVLQSMTGASLVAHGGNSGYSGSDFFLVLLKEDVPGNYNAYYNGWNREDTPSPSGVGIHHPQGDVKKISTYTSPLVSSNWQGGLYPSHWRVVWAGTLNGHGVTEGGSSGSPVFDEGGRIIGTLTGGDSSCDSIYLDDPDYYGKFYWHWDRNGTDPGSCLKYWLDPNNAGILKLDGFTIGIPGDEDPREAIVYPNPFTESFNIRYGGLPGIYRAVVSDLFGRTLIRREWPGPGNDPLTIDTGSLPAGVYLLELNTGTVRLVRKIVRLESH